MADTLETLNAGDSVRCTINKVPMKASSAKTIERLMRMDPTNKKALDHAQHLRDKRKNVYVRGNRWWTSREKSARVVRCETGNSWTMPFTFQIKPDLASVSSYLTMEKA